jgi:hypothetical protein
MAFTQHGTEVHLVDQTGVLHDTLPVANYMIKVRPNGHFYLVVVDKFQLPTRFYRKHTRYLQRIMQTYTGRDDSMGVLLTGIKGSGKSLLAKNIAAECAGLGMPTLIINEPLCGSGFNEFMQNINQPCVVLFDEFEKVYDREQQDSLLTLLDGTATGKNLWVFTCNNQHRVNDFLINRPGRVHYRIDYTTLDDTFIEDYCKEHLQDTTQMQPIANYATLFDDFNFDMLRAIVDELNRYGGTVADAVEMLNVRPVFRDMANYQVSILNDGNTVASEHTWYGNPLTEANVQFSIDDHEYRMTMKDLTKIDTRSGVYVYERDGVAVTLKRTVTQFDYTRVF